jgi:uncharacterized protein
VPTDVRDRDAIERLVQVAVNEWGRVDVLVNNAGLGYSRRVADLDPAQLREQVDVNLVAVIECAQAVLPAMLAQRSGHIINVASIAGLIGLPNSGVYCATKFAVVGFSDALRREVQRRGVHVTAFCPGFVATAFSPRLKAVRASSRRMPGVMSADYVAGQIAGLIRHPRRLHIVPPGWGNPCPGWPTWSSRLRCASSRAPSGARSAHRPALHGRRSRGVSAAGMGV